MNVRNDSCCAMRRSKAREMLSQMKRGSFLLVLPSIFLALSAGNCLAEPQAQKILYYYGNARVLNLTTGSSSAEKVIMVKTFDPANSMFSEIACYQDPGKPATLSPVYMKVSGDSFTISDSPDFNSKSLTGTGKLRGNPWDWSYLTFDMVYSGDKFSMKIDDANFVVGNQLIGRKQFFYRNPSPSPNEVGTPVELWDIEMTQIDQATYALHGKEMGCPSPSKR